MDKHAVAFKPVVNTSDHPINRPVGDGPERNVQRGGEKYDSVVRNLVRQDGAGQKRRRSLVYWSHKQQENHSVQVAEEIKQINVRVRVGLITEGPSITITNSPPTTLPETHPLQPRPPPLDHQHLFRVAGGINSVWRSDGEPNVSLAEDPSITAHLCPVYFAPLPRPTPDQVLALKSFGDVRIRTV